MYTTIIHPIRKSYNLSMNEYAVLDTIFHLSNNIKFGGWCIMSKEKIGETLDLSKQTVHTIIDTLIAKGLVEKNESTKALRSCDEWNEIIANKNDWIIGMKGEESTFISNGVKKFDSQSRNFTYSQESLPSQSRNLTTDSQETLLYNNKDNNINNNKYKLDKKDKLYLDKKDFETIWEVYTPKAGNKETCLRRFIKAKHPKDLLPKILDAIEFQKNNPRFEGYKMPMSATWINNQRWNDEVEETQQTVIVLGQS